MSSLLWQPFEQRYANYFRRLDFHKEFLSQELALMQVKGTSLALKQHDEGLSRLEAMKGSIDKYHEITSELVRKDTKEKERT
jgi:hypothetical protein